MVRGRPRERPKVTVLFKPHRRLMEELEESFEVVYFRGRLPPSDWVKNSLPGSSAVVTAPYHVVGEELLAMAGESLRLVVVYGSGYDRVDLRAADARGVCVANCPESIAEAVADHAVGLLIALIRGIVRGDSYVRSGEWAGTAAPRAFIGRTISSLTIGILGLGRVGSAVARRLSGFGARLVYWSRRRKPEAEKLLPMSYCPDPYCVAREADAVVVTVALTPQTRGLIGEDLISAMKEGAYIVNVSRGEVIDEAALVRALREGRLGGAALDVFAEEPLRPGNPLTGLGNVVLTPHIAGYTWESMEGAAEEAAQAIMDCLLLGRTPRNALTPRACAKSCEPLI